jgi:hypothetical protein
MIALPIKEILELYGELAVAAWNSGSRVRCWSALCVVVGELVSNWETPVPGYQEVFRKTGHVLGWFSTVLSTGKPPLKIADGSDYQAPTPGMFAARRPKLGELTTPMLRAILPQHLGQMAMGLNLRRAARRHLAWSVDLAKDDGLLWLGYMMQINRALAAASCGHFREALQAALEAVMGLGTTDALRTRGENPLTSTSDPRGIWQTLSDDSRKIAEDELFWLAIAPTLMDALARGRSAGVAISWSRELYDHRNQLQLYPYWDEVLRANEMAFDPVPREVVVRRINALPSSDTALRISLYFAISQASGSLTTDALNAHGIILGVLLDRERAVSLMLNDFVTYLIRYWRKVAVERGFQLRSPRVFRARMSEVAAGGGVELACRILLWAEEAVGEAFAVNIRSKLANRLSVSDR